MDRTRNGKRDRMRASWRRLRQEAQKARLDREPRSAGPNANVIEGYDERREVLRGYAIGREIVVR